MFDFWKYVWRPLGGLGVWGFGPQKDWLKHWDQPVSVVSPSSYDCEFESRYPFYGWRNKQKFIFKRSWNALKLHQKIYTYNPSTDHRKTVLGLLTFVLRTYSPYRQVPKCIVFLMGQSRPLFCLFSFFSSYNFNNTNWKKHWWCAWDSNPGRRMVGADKTTEPWRPSSKVHSYSVSNKP